MAARKTKQEDEQAPEAEPTTMVPEAQPAKTVEGLADDEQIEIRHPETGQEYGVTVKAYKDLYQPVGYLPVRKGDNSALDAEPTEDTPEPVYPEVAVEDGPVTPNVGDQPTPEE